MNRTTAIWTALATTCLAALGCTAVADGQPVTGPSSSPTRPIVLRADDGFDWTDAAVGAAAGAGVVLAAAGGITLARNK